MEIAGSFELNVCQNKPSPEFLLTRSLFYLKFFILCNMFKAGMNFELKTQKTKVKMTYWYPDERGLEIIHLQEL